MGNYMLCLTARRSAFDFRHTKGWVAAKTRNEGVTEKKNRATDVN
jgi:hypothetical protein